MITFAFTDLVVWSRPVGAIECWILIGQLIRCWLVFRKSSSVITDLHSINDVIVSIVTTYCTAHRDSYDVNTVSCLFNVSRSQRRSFPTSSGQRSVACFLRCGFSVTWKAETFGREEMERLKRKRLFLAAMTFVRTGTDLFKKLLLYRRNKTLQDIVGKIIIK